MAELTSGHAALLHHDPRLDRASVRVMRLWKPHDPGRSCLRFTIRHHVTNETDSQNAEALGLRVGIAQHQ
jgi:hypothetical protein